MEALKSSILDIGNQGAMFAHRILAGKFTAILGRWKDDQPDLL